MKEPMGIFRWSRLKGNPGHPGQQPQQNHAIMNHPSINHHQSSSIINQQKKIRKNIINHPSMVEKRRILPSGVQLLDRQNSIDYERYPDIPMESQDLGLWDLLFRKVAEQHLLHPEHMPENMKLDGCSFQELKQTSYLIYLWVQWHQTTVWKAPFPPTEIACRYRISGQTHFCVLDEIMWSPIFPVDTKISDVTHISDVPISRCGLLSLHHLHLKYRWMMKNLPKIPQSIVG